MISIMNKFYFLESMCKKHHYWVVYISLREEDFSEIEKAAPYLNFDRDYQIFADGIGFIVCDTEKEAYSIFNKTIGYDGPTEKNKYDGPARVYALVCGPNGFETENT